MRLSNNFAMHCARVLLLAPAVLVALACGSESPETPPEVAEPQSLAAIAPPVPADVAPPVGFEEPRAKRVAVSEAEVVRGPADRPYLSLVVNAGAGYPPADAILDVLASRQVRTTFFLLGWWAERNPDLVRRIFDEGHEIASHGHSVFDLTSVSDAAVVADLERADAAISAITGQTTRPLWSASAGYRDARVRRIAAQLGYRHIFWSQDSGDWRVDTTPEDVRRRSIAGIEPGAIIVLHLDSTHSRAATATVLGEIIDAARQRGLEPVTITELVGE